MAGVDLLGVELERVLAPLAWPSKAQSISADRPLPDLHACTFRPGDQATTLNTFRDLTLQVTLSVSTAERPTDDQAFFFFLLSIAQRNGSKPPPPDMKVLSFVRDVRNFEMTPNQLYLPAQFALSTFYQLISVSHATVRPCREEERC